MPYITMKNGKKFFEGSCLKNGAIIKTIKFNGVVVELNGVDFYYHIGG